MHARRASKKWLAMVAALGCAAMVWVAPSPTLAVELKISHQFAEADARNELAVQFAAKVEKATAGAVTFKIFPSSALFKAGPQYEAMLKGALDMSVFPLAYASGKVPQLEITLMPCIISGVDQGMAWRNKEIGRRVAKLSEDKGMKILTWLWYGGGIGSRGKPVILPSDVKQLKFRAAGKMFETMLNAEGASITSMASSEIYMALQTRVLDACLTSAESFISYRLYEQLEYFNTPENYSIWYMCEPLVISMKTWASLSPEHKKIFETVGMEMEKKARDDAIAANKEVTKVFKEKGVKVHAMTQDEWKAWQKVASQTAWKTFAGSVPDGQELLDLATK
jgi:TRAP-type C4-dicarboxylate transport system substrate-binding protein